MNELVPVRPRRQIIYPLDVMEDRAPSKRVLQVQQTPLIIQTLLFRKYWFPQSNPDAFEYHIIILN